MPRALLLLALLVAPAPLGAAPDDAPDATADNKPKTGSFQLTIKERSKRSAILPMTARLGWGDKAQVEAAAKKDGGETDYDISKETFDVFVPEDYTGAEPYGLIVWINPGPGGAPRGDWLDVLRKHKLIWIGSAHSENHRTRWVRLGLAIDAADYMPKVYKIDPYRIYVSGASGGGKVASILGVAFPEVFTGGAFPIIGTFYFRIVEAGLNNEGQKTYYPRGYNRPSSMLLSIAMKGRRYVLLTGDKDDNRPSTDLISKAMKKDGFKYVTYLQVPGMGHQSPDAEWFEKGIVALDAPRDEVATAAEGKGKGEATTASTSEASADATAATAPVAKAQPRADAPATGPDAEAEKLMRLAKLYLDNRMYNKARDKLNLIVTRYPTSAPAAEAQKILKEIGKK